MAPRRPQGRILCGTAHLDGGTDFRRRARRESTKEGREGRLLYAPGADQPPPSRGAATYPLELIQLQQWLVKNKGRKDKGALESNQQQKVETKVVESDRRGLPRQDGAVPRLLYFKVLKG